MKKCPKNSFLSYYILLLILDMPRKKREDSHFRYEAPNFLQQLSIKDSKDFLHLHSSQRRKSCSVDSSLAVVESF